MKITDVRIRKINDEGKMKAVVSITFDDEFVVHDIKIIDGQNGLFIAMPSRKMGEGDFRDIAHPLLSETRNKIKDAIFTEYEKMLAEKDLEMPAKEPDVVAEDEVEEEVVVEEEDKVEEEVAEETQVIE
jgi:stage V sporulation protein G